MSKTTDDLLVERARVHGDYDVNAHLSQRMKVLFRQSRNWDNLNDSQKESLDMIASKISRALTGDPNHADHWDDIAGYARLAVIAIIDETQRLDEWKNVTQGVTKDGYD